MTKITVGSVTFAVGDLVNYRGRHAVITAITPQAEREREAPGPARPPRGTPPVLDTYGDRVTLRFADGDGETMTTPGLDPGWRGFATIHEWRCTRPAMYTVPSCPGYMDVAARQGYYVLSQTRDGARRIMAEDFPGETFDVPMVPCRTLRLMPDGNTADLPEVK